MPLISDLDDFAKLAGVAGEDSASCASALRKAAPLVPILGSGASSVAAESTLRLAEPAAANASEVAEPFNFVLAGAPGDLSKRKLFPALYELFRDGHFPDNFSIVGTGREDLSEPQFRTLMEQSLHEFSPDLPFDKQTWDAFSEHVHYRPVNLTDGESVANFKQEVDQISAAHGTTGRNLLYLSTQPSIFEPTIQNFSNAGLLSRTSDGAFPRLAVEKPFGHDLASSEQLDSTIHGIMGEGQTFRVDHYLGKQAVEDIPDLRQQYEPVWNNRFVSGLSVNHAETLGVGGGRAAYYDHAGQLRDMVQGHLTHVVSLATMDLPDASMGADGISAAKVQLLKDLRPIDPAHVDDAALRGQYGPGFYGNDRVVGYRGEQGVATGSNTETFANLHMAVDNDRWRGVPIELRTGKRMPASVTDLTVHFKPPYDRPNSPLLDTKYGAATRLEYRIQPDPKSTLWVATAPHAPEMPLNLDHEEMGSSQGTERTATGYERLLLDFIEGNRGRFTPSDFLQESWKHWQPVLDNWDTTAPAQRFPNYAANTWGPGTAAKSAVTA